MFCIKSSLIFSQNFYKIDYDYTDKNNFTCNSTLYTNNKEAVCKINDLRAGGVIDLADGKVDNVDNDEIGRFFYSNNELSYTRAIVYEREVLYSDMFDSKINWNIMPEVTSKKSGYNCTKATITINGRSFTVWFTFDVPVNFGPLKLHKLPGLIIEVKEDMGFLMLKLKSVSKTKSLVEFNRCKQYFIKSKSVITYDQYEKKITDAEVNVRVTSQARMKKYNAKNGTDNRLSFEDDVTAMKYLELSSNFLSEMKKYNGK